MVRGKCFAADLEFRPAGGVRGINRDVIQQDPWLVRRIAFRIRPNVVGHLKTVPAQELDRFAFRRGIHVARQNQRLPSVPDHGVRQVSPEEAAPDAPVLVGNLPADGSDSVWQRLHALAEEGRSVLFLRSDPFAGHRDEHKKCLTDIAGSEARCYHFNNWLYHMDNIRVDSPVFANLPKESVCDMETYDQVYPANLILDTKPADRVFCAGIGLNCFIEKNCARSLTLAEFRRGKGVILLNTMRIEENLGKSPVADQLLLKLLSVYGHKQ